MSGRLAWYAPDMTLSAAVVFLVVGAFSLVGGILGFTKAGSRASLIAGGLSGLLMLAAGGWVMAGATTRGLVLGGATSALLAGRFVPAYLKTKKVMPQGVMSALSLVGALAAAVGYFSR